MGFCGLILKELGGFDKLICKFMLCDFGKGAGGEGSGGDSVPCRTLEVGLTFCPSPSLA